MFYLGLYVFKRSFIKIILVLVKNLFNFSFLTILYNSSRLGLHVTTLKKRLSSTNHKQIGCIYLFFGAVSGALLGFCSGTVLQAEPTTLISLFLNGNDQPYSVTTVTPHVVVMIFLMIMPALTGVFGNWFLPFLTGSADMAFSRLNISKFLKFTASKVRSVKFFSLFFLLLDISIMDGQATFHEPAPDFFDGIFTFHSDVLILLIAILCFLL